MGVDLLRLNGWEHLPRYAAGAVILNYLWAIGAIKLDPADAIVVPKTTG